MANDHSKSSSIEFKLVKTKQRQASFNNTN